AVVSMVAMSTSPVPMAVMGATQKERGCPGTSSVTFHGTPLLRMLAWSMWGRTSSYDPSAAMVDFASYSTIDPSVAHTRSAGTAYTMPLSARPDAETTLCVAV